jgi:XTP/dITP diphosphohydrolase
MRKAPHLVLASNNRHKLEEFSALLKGYPGLTLHSAEDYISNSDKLGLVETSDRYMDNALAKARACNHACHYPSLADDSGLEVDALEGGPGVRSHRFAIPKKGQTQDQANCDLLLQKLEGLPSEKRTARFICHLALVMEGLSIHAVGICEGTITSKKMGDGGFGYDPLFIPNGETKTFSELGPEFKNIHSHRALALKNLMQDVQSRGLLLVKP